MIIWSGWGFLVAVIVFGTSLAMELVTEAVFGDNQYYQVQSWPLALALAISGVIIWKIGAYLQTKGGHHRLFFVPMQYLGPVLIALSVLPFILR